MKELLTRIDKLQEEINKHRPFDTDMLKSIKEYYRIGLTYTSNKLEGNSLTESETKVVIEEGITIGGKRLVDHLEVVGHSEAYDFLYNLVGTDTVTEDDIKELHKLFYYRIDPKRAGVYRTIKVYITGSNYPLPAPKELPTLMEHCVKNIQKFRQTEHPVVAAAKAHKDFVFVHPFIDGNGRVARLLMNLILLQMGYTIAVIPPILRSQYINALEKAHTDEHDFIEFIAEIVKESQQDFIRLFLD